MDTVRRLKAREKRAAKRLLASESHTLRSSSSVVRNAVDHVVAKVATAPDDDVSQRKAANAHIREAVAAMVMLLGRSIRDARMRARAEGRALAVADASVDGLPDADEQARLDEEDTAAAQVAANSYAAAWGAAAMLAVRRWARGEVKSLPSALAKTVPTTEGRLRRIAVTETAQAFNAERALVAGELVAATEAKGPTPATALAHGTQPVVDVASGGGGAYRAPPGYEVPPRILKIWSAILDARVCDECARMHGTAVAGSAEFPGGDPPRHPFCRCIFVTIRTTATANEVEREFRAA